MERRGWEKREMGTHEEGQGGTGREAQREGGIRAGKGRRTERGRRRGWGRDRLMEMQKYTVIHSLTHSFIPRWTDRLGSGRGISCWGQDWSLLPVVTQGWESRMVAEAGRQLLGPPAQPCPAPSPGVQPLRTRLLLLLPPPASASHHPCSLPWVCLLGPISVRRSPLGLCFWVSLSLCLYGSCSVCLFPSLFFPVSSLS